MNKRIFPFPSSFRAYLAFSLAFALVASVPFGHALEIHHVFSEIDHDGHQHSDSDLCQWVQQHTSNSLPWELPQWTPRSWLYSLLSLPTDQVVLSFASRILHSRGPPKIHFF